MNECKHEFIGTSLGVHCVKCGLTLTAEEYAMLVQPKKTSKPSARKKVKQ